MKLNSDYSSDISSLLNEQRKDTLFISTWDKDEEILPFPSKKIAMYGKIESDQASKYFFSDELFDLKKYILSENGEFLESHIAASNFTFVSNGTIAAWLSLLTIQKEIEQIKVLLLSPIYYIYVEMLRQLKADIYYESACNADFTKIYSTIISNKINLVIINNPFFGTGICIPNEIINTIQAALLKTNGCILIDNIYNGLKWEQTASLNDFELYNKVSCYHNFIILESLAKNLFLNGIKHCSIFSSSEWIDKIEKNSVLFFGSITAQQYNYIQKLYSQNERSFIMQQLTQNIDYAQNNYYLLFSMLTNKKIYVSNCVSGIYCLFGIPRSKFNSQNDLSIAKEILIKSNVLTLPHDRYLYTDQKNYCFRINLMAKRETLYKSISALQNCFDI